jgi:hypothetical protein
VWFADKNQFNRCPPHSLPASASAPAAPAAKNMNLA